MPSGNIVRDQIRSLAAAVQLWTSLPKQRRAPAPAPAEICPADQAILTRAARAEPRSAIVMSLWASSPAWQCAVQARYAPGPTPELEQAVSTPVPAPMPVQARALQARLALNFATAATPAPAFCASLQAAA